MLLSHKYINRIFSKYLKFLFAFYTNKTSKWTKVLKRRIYVKTSEFLWENIP